jgi:transglutaminase-like putative cysteine protease
MSILVPITLGAVTVGTLMSLSRFDSFFALSHALFAGLAWILFLMARLAQEEDIAPFLDKGVPELQARVYFVLLRLLNWLDAAFNNAASADNFVFIFEISFLVWWLTFLGMWSIMRFGYVWRAVIPAGVVMLVNTYFAPEPVYSLLGLFALLAIFLFIRTNLAEQQLRWRDQHTVVSQEMGWDFVRTALTYSVIVLALAGLAPGLGRNVQVRQLLSPLNERWEQTSQDLTRLYQGLNRRPAPAGTSFGRNLPLGGPRVVGDALVFNVDAPAGRYWRAVVYDTFTGTEWVNTGETEAQIAPGQPVPVAAWAERAPLTQTVTLLAPMSNVVLGAPDLRRIDMPVSVLANGVPNGALDGAPLAEGLPGAVEFTMVRAAELLDMGDRYTLLSNATAATERALGGAGEEYPLEIVDRYVQIPPEFPAEVVELAQSLTVTATTPYSKAKAIEGYLRTIPYNDAIEAPPPGRDPISYFLFDIRQGYCDYYATSMAMMLRTLGIPARTASGYAEGSYDEQAELFYVSERDAHTWVEVFFPGLGWVEFEPTAGESPLDRPRGEESAAAPGAVAPTPVFPTPVPGETDANLENQLQPDPGLEDTLGGQSTALFPWWAWALLVPLVIAAVLLFIWRVRVAGPTAFTPELPLLAFDRLQRWAARLGLAPGPSQTPYEQARRWSRALPASEPPIRTVADSYVHYRFARPAPDAPGPNGDAAYPGLTQAWTELQPALWKAWLRRLLLGRRALKPGNGVGSAGKNGDRNGVNGDHYTLVDDNR